MPLPASCSATDVAPRPRVRLAPGFADSPGVLIRSPWRLCSAGGAPWATYTKAPGESANRGSDVRHRVAPPRSILRGIRDETRVAAALVSHSFARRRCRRPAGRKAECRPHPRRRHGLRRTGLLRPPAFQDTEPRPHGRRWRAADAVQHANAVLRPNT